MKWHEWQRKNAPHTLAGDCSCNEMMQADEDYKNEMRYAYEARSGRNLVGCLLLASGVFWICVTIAVIYSVS